MHRLNFTQEDHVHKRTLLKTALRIGAATTTLGAARWLRAQEPIKLRIAHFVPPMHVAHRLLLAPWAERVEKDSGGRIKCELYPSMQLGGKPPQLFDQARTGVADIVWTVPAYTPGRFPLSSVLELPFVVGASARVSAHAMWAFYKQHLRDEYKEVQPLLLHCHAPGLVHMQQAAAQRIEDLKGRKLRLPNKPLGEAFALLGATPIGMPVSEAYEALSRGVVEGISLPWEAMKAFRLNELTKFHTITELYTTVFLVAMNKRRYDALAPDLKAVIDRHSGDAWIDEAGRLWDEAERPGLQQARELGHPVAPLAPEEKERWKRAMQPVIDGWIASTPKGRMLYDDAWALLEQHRKSLS